MERIRRAAALWGITKVETRGDRLMLTRRGDFLPDGTQVSALDGFQTRFQASEILRFLEALKQ